MLYRFQYADTLPGVTPLDNSDLICGTIMKEE
jgi:hypothetical protein